jgi:hypothetical protein
MTTQIHIIEYIINQRIINIITLLILITSHLFPPLLRGLTSL